MPVDLTKPMQTRDGREVRIYATDGIAPAIVHGAFRETGLWQVCTWLFDGHHPCSGCQNLDLVNVKPRITKDLWVEVSRQYEGCTPIFSLGPRTAKTIALVKVTIDCEEGEGL